jgi:asparagine synthase (glutamine-hydrolysing)
MCGIVSIFAYKGGPVDREELKRVRDHLASRGPDGYGEWYSEDNRVGIGHRRLAIIDLSERGDQPMATEDGRLVITFNGEIYNYKNLRAELERKGYRFHSQSDTEVLLHLYAEKGFDMLKDLRGMFAFGIWDDKKKGLFIARDPFGIKPLYYADDGKTFYVASQVKALLKVAHMDSTPDAAGHVGFFLWGHVPEPYTFYKGIRSLPVGLYMWIDSMGNKETGAYCRITEILSDSSGSHSDMNREEVKLLLRTALLDTVRHHLIADVPVGIFLSSGMDSTTLVALASEINQAKINTITMGFKEYIDTLNDETPLATLTADRYGTTHRTIWVSKKDFEEDFLHLLQSMDQPTTDGVNSYFVSKTAKKAGLKVVLSGLGGDEIFGGYPSFSQIPRIVNMLGPFKNLPLLGKGFRIVSYPLLKHMTSPKYAGLFEYGGSYSGAYLLRRGMFMPWELPQLLNGEMVREGWRELQTILRLDETISKIESPYRRISAFEISWYMRNQLLRDTDWAGMAHSIEIRVPLVDVEFLRHVAPLLGGASSPGKKEMASTPLKPLPPEVIKRGKTGFSIPTRQWILEDHKELRERGLRGWARFVYDRFNENQ